MTVHEQIKHEVDALPAELAREVLDFTLFVKARYTDADEQRIEEEFLWQKVLEAREYRRQHPEDVMTVTAEEWETLSAELEAEAE
jgi:hypothetical protein